MTDAGRGDFDHATLRAAFAGPGMDTRTWISYAIVDVPTDGQGDSQTVEFDQDDGQLYVNLQLKPSDIPLRARLGMVAAGSGEAFYFPFCGGEEVLVAIPEGDMMAGAVVLCRLNNAYDGFPFDSVGGADPTKNSTAIWRTRTALTIESGASVQIRSAAAGAMLLLGQEGGITLRDGKANVLQMSADVFGYQTGDGANFLQLDLSGGRFNLQIGSTSFTLAGSAASSGVPYSALVSPLQFVMAAGGTAPDFTAVEHVLTTEALFNILFQLATLLTVPPVSLAPTATAGALGAVLLPLLNAVIPVAAAGAMLPTLGAAIQAAFATPIPKTPGIPGFGQLKPGIGCAGFIAG